jgi:hypothetical protein
MAPYLMTSLRDFPHELRIRISNLADREKHRLTPRFIQHIESAMGRLTTAGVGWITPWGTAGETTGASLPGRRSARDQLSITDNLHRGYEVLFDAPDGALAVFVLFEHPDLVHQGGLLHLGDMGD